MAETGKRQVILDTETTGLNAHGGDRVIEIAALEIVSRKKTGHYLHFRFNPEREIDSQASAVHGLYLHDLVHERRFHERAQEIYDFLRGAELIIHNAEFDINFLNMEFARSGFGSLEEVIAGVVDTLILARDKYPGKKASLDALCERFEIDLSQRVKHGALVDSELLLEVYLALTRDQFALNLNQLPEWENSKKTIYYGENDFKVVRAKGSELADHEASLMHYPEGITPLYLLNREKNP